jgi:integrase
VDLDAAEVTFGGSTAVVRGQRVEGTTKGGRSRTISIDHDTVTVLREHHRQQTEERQAAGSAWTDSGLVFTTRSGEPLYPDTVTALMSKLIREHNKCIMPPAKPLPHARLHDLRHLHATTLLLAGSPSTW